MLKKTITYDDYNGNEITEDFYFNFTKLEIMEKELELGGLEETVRRLSATTDAPAAYAIFKDLVLAAYGKKSEDGRQFIKSPELLKEFEQSPASSELIIEFLNNPDSGAQFIEGTLPAKLVADVKKEAARKASKEPLRSDHEVSTAPPVLETVKPDEKGLDEYTRDELIEMPQEQFQALVGTDPRKMKKDHLIIAMQRKNTQ